MRHAPPDTGRSFDPASATRGLMILGGDADGNLGDRAILQAMSTAFARLLPGLRITVVTSDPARAQRLYGARSVAPGPNGFLALCRAIRSSSLVLVGGGGLFQDDDSLVKMPYWAMRVLLVRLLGRRVVGYALGVGPLASASSRLAARLAFALMDRISVRDPNARRVAQPLTRRAVEVVPDPAIGLVPAPAGEARRCLADAGVPLDGRPLIGVALRRWFPSRPRIVPHKIARRIGVPDPQAGPEGERLLSVVARALDEMVAAHDAFAVFLPSYTVSHEADDALCRGVLARMAPPRGAMLRLDDPSLYKACCGELGALLGGRMHPMILAAAMGTPVVGFAYNPKFHGLMALLGEPDACVDVADVIRRNDAGTLAFRLHTAIRRGRRPTQPAEAMAARLAAFDASLLAMLDG